MCVGADKVEGVFADVIHSEGDEVASFEEAKSAVADGVDVNVACRLKRVAQGHEVV